MMITKMWKLESILLSTFILMDIFWSDEFVISEKEGMYFTKTIRIEDELRHER